MLSMNVPIHIAAENVINKIAVSLVETKSEIIFQPFIGKITFSTILIH